MTLALMIGVILLVKYKYIFKYNTDHIIIINVFTANVVIDLCHERDNYYQCPLHLYSYVELKDFFKSLCTL